MRISNSFSEGEVQVLWSLVQAATQRGDVTVIARSPHFASLGRKVMAMRERVRANEAAKEGGDA